MRSRPFFLQLLHDTMVTCLALFKITLPISAVTQLLVQWGAMDLIGQILAPLMGVFGLPGEMGVVWGSAMLTNLYGGLSVFATLPAAGELTVAQISVLTTMMLMAHGLPVEMSITRKAGVRLRCSLVVRLGGAVIAGVCLHVLYRYSGWLAVPTRALWQPPPVLEGWQAWLIGQGRNLLSITVIIFVLLLVMRMLEAIGVIGWLTGSLRPFLRLLGISPAAAPVTMIGMFLGLSYGGGLIIQEAHSGRLPIRDVALSLSFMGLCHSLVEDSLLMAVVGGHWSAILVGRVIVSISVIVVLQRVLTHLSPVWLQRHVYAAKSTTEQAD